MAVEIYEYRSHDTQTDSEGRYVFEDPSAGYWQIYALEGYARSDNTPTYTLTVKAGQDNILDMPWPC